MAEQTTPKTIELTEQEKKSLAEGQRIADEKAAQDKAAYEEVRREHEAQIRYANKFTSAEELEKAYLELQRKLGEAGKEEQSEGEPQQQQEEQPNEEPQQEQPPAQEKAPPSEPPAPQPLSEEDATKILESAGGKETYEAAIGWAKEGISQEEQAAFNNVLRSGDPNLIGMAVRGLVARFKTEGDYQGQMVTGKKPAPNVKGFQSRAQVADAISDPRYDRDPAYRLEVMERLKATDDQRLYALES